ncbi:hypothetical protein [Burkholderia gladioli]|uniref:hypothetical protein n=1 Tax=Burkholderia gladioli TaxID=28095 RepID=UPI00163DF13D|nr:hypothetical protein [Burkholderia gladioli]
MGYSLRFIRMCDPFSDRPYPATRDNRGMRPWLVRFGRAMKRKINADAARLDDQRVAEQIRPADFLTGNTMIVSSAGAGGDDCLAALLGAHSATGGGFVLLDTMFDPEPWADIGIDVRGGDTDHVAAILPLNGAAQEHPLLVASIRNAALRGMGLYSGMPGWLKREDRTPATGTMLAAVLAALAGPDAPTIPPRRPFIVAIRDVDQWPQDRLDTLFGWAPTVGIRIIVTTRFDRLGRTAQAVPAAGQFESTLIFRPGSHHQAEMAAQWLDMDDPHAADRLRSMDRGRCVIMRGGETRYGWLTRTV